MTATANYRARMQRALDHIDEYLDGDLNLDSVSAVAALSKFHFHRQFSATFGLPVHRYVQLARLKRASQNLASQKSDRITDVALEAGYDAPDAFARVFRQHFGQSPSSFRKSPDWNVWLQTLGPLENARSKLMQITFQPDDVSVREMPAVSVAMVEHRGARTGIPDTRERFLKWSKAHGLSPETGRHSYMVFRSEREPAEPAEYSMDLCVGTDQPIEANEEGVKAGVIPAGRFAVLRYPANSNNLEEGALYLYREWLPASGEEAADFPLFCRRALSAIAGTSAHEVIAELFLPLK